MLRFFAKDEKPIDLQFSAQVLSPQDIKDGAMNLPAGYDENQHLRLDQIAGQLSQP